MKRVIQEVAIMNRGGQETLWMNVFRKIDRTKLVFDFLVYSTEKGDYDDEIKDLGGKVIYIGNNPYQGKISKYFGEIKRVKEFFKTHKEYDTYHINTCHAMALFNVIGAHIAGVPRIIVHSHNTNAVHPTLHKLVRPFLNMFKFEAFACSNEAGEWMFGKRKMRKGKVKIVKNGIDTGNYQFDENIRNKKRAELGITDSTKVIGHIGRFNYQKNHSFLVDIFEEITKKYDNCKLLLVGRGELEDEIRAKVVEKGLNDKVLFLGVRSDVNELLLAFDAFLFPSLFEGLPVVMIEAQASGVPMVCSSSIPAQADLTRDILWFPLDKTASDWAEVVIKQMELGRGNDIEAVIRSGYDILHTAKELERYYLDNKG